MTATEDRELRRAVHGLLQSLPPSPAPIPQIVRRGKGIRLRRAGGAAGTLALALAGIVAVAVLAPPGSRRPAVPGTVPASPAAPGGVFAQGRADGRAWQLAVQDIADPGYPCQPAIVLNGTDADPVFPAAGNAGAVSLAPSLPGTAFGFIQVPAAVTGVAVNGQAVRAVTVAACSLGYHLVGFAYPLARAVRVTLAHPPPGWQAVFTMPQVSAQPPSKSTTPETAGLWVNIYPPGDAEGSGPLDSELVYGPDWSMEIQFGAGGDCYAFSASGSAGATQMGDCGPVSTPTGPETIMTLPLGVSSNPPTGLTGYAVQVSPATAGLKATLSNGSSELAQFCVVDGRNYAVLVVRAPLRLARLTWLNAAGQVIASTTALPRYGFVQFQP